MAKTGKQIQGDVYRLLRDSTLYTMISGEVYRKGYRPRDSRKEDAIVTFTSGFADEVQTGIVTINIYVPDIDPDNNGTWIEDGIRTEQIEKLAQLWVESLTAEVSCYKFRLNQTIYTEDEPKIHQHFVVVKLAYRYYGDDNAPILTPQMAVIDTTDTDGNDAYEPILITENGKEVTIYPNMDKQNTNN